MRYSRWIMSRTSRQRDTDLKLKVSRQGFTLEGQKNRLPHNLGKRFLNTISAVHYFLYPNPCPHQAYLFSFP